MASVCLVRLCSVRTGGGGNSRSSSGRLVKHPKGYLLLGARVLPLLGLGAPSTYSHNNAKLLLVLLAVTLATVGWDDLGANTGVQTLPPSLQTEDKW